MWIAVWQVLLELSPWLLLGALVAGLLHVLVPPSLVRRQLSGPLGVVKAVAVGVPLPLCSCGVIPAGLGLRKDGASKGATIGFLISTPQTGVDSILVSASFLGWPFALFKVASAAATGLVGGWLADAVEPATTATPAALDAPRAIQPRGLRALVAHSLEILETIWGWLVFGVVVSAAITTYVPPGTLAGLAAGGGLLAMLGTLLIAMPLYVCATASVPIAAALVSAGLPTGAALVFLMAGPATNLATIGAVYRTLGARALAVYLGVIAAGSIGLGMVFDGVIAPASVAANLHHHHHEAAWWSIAAALVVVALIARFALLDAARALRRWRARPDAPNGLEIEVVGMTCQSCVARLERQLGGADGVTHAEVVLEPGLARVSGPVSETRLRELVAAAGFTPGTVRSANRR